LTSEAKFAILYAAFAQELHPLRCCAMLSPICLPNSKGFAMTVSMFAPRTRLHIAQFCFAVHVLANLAMLAVLVSGIPPGPLGVRRAFVAAHPTEWALGWGVWMLAAASLILLYLAFADSLPRQGWTVFAILVTSIGAALDWGVLGVTALLAPGWAALARGSSFYADLYVVWDRAFLILSVGLDHGLYTLGGIVLSAVASQTPGFPRWLMRLSAAVWGTSLVLTVAAFSGQTLWIVPASGLTFTLFLPWIVLLGYGWLRREQY
jgi:hypothetical protein